MRRYPSRTHPELAAALSGGAIGVLRTDTLYGLVASVSRPDAIERVYAARGRQTDKPCIILIADVGQLLSPLPAYAGDELSRYWPGPASIILPTDSSVPEWLHRGSHSLAYRLPADDELRALLRRTGPLIAPSANPEGLSTATTVAAAERYFGEAVDFYVDGGAVGDDVVPSRLLRLHPDGRLERLR